MWQNILIGILFTYVAIDLLWSVEGGAGHISLVQSLSTYISQPNVLMITAVCALAGFLVVMWLNNNEYHRRLGVVSPRQE